MGYWEEKAEYEDTEEKDFCSACGRKLNSKNIKGKCAECGEIVCNNCSRIEKGKIICLNCEGGTKITEDECGHCGKRSKIVATCQYRGLLGTVCTNGEVCTQKGVISRYIPRRLCKNCAKKCKKCGKYFCPIHLKKHKCV